MSHFFTASRLRAAIIGLMLVPLGVPAQNLPDLGDVAQADLPPALERRIGESLWRDVRASERTYISDPEVSGYLNQLADKLVAKLPDSRQDFELFALRDPTLNAFAWPGGFIGVHSGLIITAQSESELASVIAHEISHVTQRHIARQFAKRGEMSVIAIASLIVAALAARGNSQAAQAALVGGQAASIAAQLAYTRDFEREADRIGLQMLDGAGFDTRAMAAFFERIQRSSRLYEGNAPSYLRTHPLTAERIADASARIQQTAYRQVPDSIDFLLVRAKLRAYDGDARAALAEFDERLRDVQGNARIAARFGLAHAALRLRDFTHAQQEVDMLRAERFVSPMLDSLAGQISLDAGNAAVAVDRFRDGLKRAPHARALTYGLIEALLADKRPQEALDVVNDEVTVFTQDPQLFQYQARTYALLGKRLAQHRAQAEAYVLNGQLQAAVEQLELAQRAADGDFYQQSAVDARLRDLRERQVELRRDGL
ncbi:MAG: M48 family metalloprotease [Gammaproteobacteria bacterium]|jgi:beta-barrel assembly-enhancing protease|nr:M48 family metalloprotease [Gammaproteobacteria bacterium]MBU0770421.1 M48 family metalloprotease [Gammaproteobacteria bacterium]MBU0855149.1 M48 family metalloprotease [Gammaproteobacteria bacterium]MBU1847339.1 M48 family metalloprotease [Gammaproteobacteria bacterium]